MRTVGIDEVGRGSLAGPLVAGAVLLTEAIPGAKDSKLLTAASRFRLDAIIRSQAVAFGIGWVASSEIDCLGLTASVALAYRRALSAILEPYDQIIIDGNYNYLADNPLSVTLIRADQLIPSVSAASIIAKVARDTFMHEMDTLYPQYGFKQHVGYGTSVHLRALRQFGPCDLHRLSFRPVSDVAKLRSYRSGE